MKKLISFLIFLVLTGGSFAADIVPGQTYKISPSSSSTRSLFTANASLSNNINVVIWTETNVNAQRWIITKTADNRYQLTNAYSGKILYRRGTNATDGAAVAQQNASDAAAGKWDLTPVSGQDGYFYITQPNSDASQTFYLEADGTADNSSVVIRTLKTGTTANRQIWKLDSETAIPNLLTREIAEDLATKWAAKYYKKATTGYILGNGGWWGDAEMFEVVLDAYETTGDSKYETMFRELYTNFTSSRRNGTNWSGNDYNDDIAWMVLASVRGYLMFGDMAYITYAKANFDRMYTRALMPSGMLRWKENDATYTNSTNSCINGPAEVAACYLAIALPDERESYYTKAKDLYALQRQYLYNPSTGHVYDSFIWNGDTPSNYNQWASTYNQGTFLGAAIMLYNHYGDEQYKADAEKIMEYTRKNLCDANGIISVCQVGSGDFASFKGILMRYVRRLVVDLQKTEYIDWMRKNALQAYNNRNSAGVSSAAWLKKATENFSLLDCTENCSFNNVPEGPTTALSAAFNALPSIELNIKGAFSKIEGENFDYIKGVHVQAGTDDATSELANVKKSFYTGYNNVYFGDNQATSVEVRVSKSSTNATIEVRLGSPTGELLGTIDVPQSGDTWQTVSQAITPTGGKQNIYLVYNTTGSQSDLFKVNWFRFKAEGYMYPDITDNGGILSASVSGNELKNVIDNRLDTKSTFGAKDVWVQYQSPVPVSVKGYALVAADDATKDPKTWKLQASNNGTDWTDLDTQTNQQFTVRYQKREFNLPTNSYTYFRLHITDTNGSSELQLADWQIYGCAIFNDDITADGGTLTAQYSGSGPNETYIKLTDKNTESKYLVTEGSDLWVQYKSTGNYRLTSYAITSASDEPERDPRDWMLYGSTNGTDWVLIDQQFSQQFNYRNVTQYYTCDVDAGYQYFKLHVTANNEAATTQMAEWQLLGSFYYDRFYNDITLNGGELTSSQSAEANSAEIKALTDNNGDSSYTLNTAELPAWVQYKSTVPVQLRGYSITGGTGDATPTDWEILGSNDGEQWTAIHSRSDITFSMKGERLTYPVSNTSKFLYFRLNITKLSGDNAVEVKIGEWELHGTSVSSSDITANKGTLTSEYAGISALEGLDKLTDKSGGTKYSVSFSSSAWVSYQSSVPAKVMIYSITAANNDDRDPKSWTLEASTNGTNWDVIDTRTNEAFLYRYATQYYTCNNDKKEYTYFRLNITENSGGDRLQIAEWQLFEGEDEPNKVTVPGSDQDIAIYPNPFAEAFYIQMSEAGLVQLYTVSGRLIYMQELSKGLHSIKPAQCEKGMYLLQISTGNKVVTKRIIKY